MECCDEDIICLSKICRSPLGLQTRPEIYRENGRSYFWKMIWHVFKKKVQLLPMIIRVMVTGYNFRKDIDTYRLALFANTRLKQ
ncbi:DUF4070 domain-containing protein [Chloroflexota bacterium]